MKKIIDCKQGTFVILTDRASEEYFETHERPNDLEVLTYDRETKEFK